MLGGVAIESLGPGALGRLRRGRAGKAVEDRDSVIEPDTILGLGERRHNSYNTPSQYLPRRCSFSDFGFVIATA